MQCTFSFPPAFLLAAIITLPPNQSEAAPKQPSKTEKTSEATSAAGYVTGAVGDQVADFSLNDYQGQPFTLSKHAAGKPVVLAILGVECPLAKLYAARLAELSQQYKDKGIAFVGIDANRQDSATEIAAFARQHKIDFPILKDLNQTVVDRLGATRTPEVLLLDAERRVRYRGRIDDQYGLVANAGYQRKEPSRRDLAEAIDELLAGKPISTTLTTPTGCLIGRDRKPVANSDVTYSNQVSRILNANCVYCHRQGQIATFTLTSYDDAAGWAGMIQEVTQAGRMPPWHADPAIGHFKNDARLSDADKATLAKWVAAGAPEGEAKDLPEPPKFAAGWLMPEPDQVVTMSDKPFDVPATGVVDYQMFVVDPGWKEDKWISAIEARPGNPAVVHHILLFVLPPGETDLAIGRGNDFTGAYAPGARPEPLPAGMARRAPAGSKLVFQMHYTPNGSPQQDRSYVGLKFVDPKTVKQEVIVTSAINFALQIPPEDNDYQARARYVFTQDLVLTSLMPHMHLRGKSFRYDVTYPDGRQETLLSVPKYDFGWQTTYRLAEPRLLPIGSRLDCLAEFDNSEENLNNPDPKVTVGFGDQTFEEMMIGFFEIADPHQDLTQARQEATPPRVQRFLTILKATRGEPDDNLKMGIHLALSSNDWFKRFGQVLPMSAPQVDRVCLTVVEKGKLRQRFGPYQLRAKEGPQPPETLRSSLPPFDPAGEPLAECAAGEKTIVYGDLTKAKGELFKMMAARGARSSMHVPIAIGGVRGTVNFWSRDPDAFPPQAAQMLTMLTKAMKAPDVQPAGAKP
ncbi:MAG TPA: redoxin domain-containing protein [Pirellulales bacterium]|jgi:peroxiredoxin